MNAEKGQARTDLRTARGRAAWMFKLARARPLPRPGSRAWTRLEREARAFVGLRRQQFGPGKDLTAPPVRAALAELAHVLGYELGRGGGAHLIELSRWTTQIAQRKGRLVVGAELSESPWRDAFWWRVYETLAAVRGRARFCQRPSCGLPFLAVKRQQYCSGCAPSGAERNRSYYERRKGEILKRRKRAYKMRVLSHTG